MKAKRSQRWQAPCRCYGTSKHESSGRARPNPSLERTSTGLARDPMQGIIPSRGPSRQRSAQLKR